MALFNPEMLQAAVAGLGVALIAGPMGSFIVWRRMAYFGDSLSHAALLGVALGIVIGANVDIAIIVVCIALASLFVGFSNTRFLASDTLLGIMAHAGLSLGLVAIALTKGADVDLEAYLFGNILAVDLGGLYWIFALVFVSYAALILIWRGLLSMTVNEDLARVEGVPVTLIRFVFMAMLALVIAVTMKVVGVLLITALLIIPPAAARRFSRSPETMAALGTVLGMGSVLLGLWASETFATPTGPTIVVAALAIFMIGLLAPVKQR